MHNKPHCLSFLILFFVLSNTVAQNISFPKGIEKDSVNLHNQIKKTSKTLLKTIEKDSSYSHYNNLFHLQMLASKYEKAKYNMDRYLDAYSKDRLREGRIFIYEVYAEAKKDKKHLLKKPLRSSLKNYTIIYLIT